MRQRHRVRPHGGAVAVGAAAVEGRAGRARRVHVPVASLLRSTVYVKKAVTTGESNATATTAAETTATSQSGSCYLYWYSVQSLRITHHSPDHVPELLEGGGGPDAIAAPGLGGVRGGVSPRQVALVHAAAVGYQRGDHLDAEDSERLLALVRDEITIVLLLTSLAMAVSSVYLIVLFSSLRHLKCCDTRSWSTFSFHLKVGKCLLFFGREINNNYVYEYVTPSPSLSLKTIK